MHILALYHDQFKVISVIKEIPEKNVPISGSYNSDADDSNIRIGLEDLF